MFNHFRWRWKLSDMKEGDFFQAWYTRSVNHGLNREIILEEEEIYASIPVTMTLLYARQRQKHRLNKGSTHLQENEKKNIGS